MTKFQHEIMQDFDEQPPTPHSQVIQMTLKSDG